MIKLIKIVKSQRKDKKYDAILNDDGEIKRVPFGGKKLVDGKFIPYTDFTITRDEDKKERYLDRHREREDWTKSGIFTPGFWSRWILWNKPTLEASIVDTIRRFDL
jgi:hypothetical protein